MCRRWLFLLGLIVLLLPEASRADDWYIKIEGIPGELTAGPFKGWSRLTSVSGMMSRAGVPGSPTPGRTDLACAVGKAPDRMSPKLMETCANGDIRRRVSISFVPTTPPATRYRITLEDVKISSYNQGFSSNPGDPAPSEQVSLNFTKIEFSFCQVHLND